MLSCSLLFEKQELTPNQEKFVHLMVGDNPYERINGKLYLKKTDKNPRIEITPEMSKAYTKQRQEDNRRLRPLRALTMLTAMGAGGASTFYPPYHFAPEGSFTHEVLPWFTMGPGVIGGIGLGASILLRDAKRRGVEFYRNYNQRKINE